MDIRMNPSPSLSGLALTLAAMFAGGAIFGAILARATAPALPPAAPSVLQVPQPMQQAGGETPPSQDPTSGDLPAADTLAGTRPGLRIGSAAARVQIVSFEDPLCGYCKQLSSGPMKQLIAEYVATGQVAVNYRHYAFLAPESTTLATALECAADQGKFESLHQVLVANTGGAVNLEAWAAQAGIAGSTWTTCLSGGKASSIVQADLEAGRRFGVRGTPTLFVNGKRIVGLMPYEMLKATVEQALAD